MSIANGTRTGCRDVFHAFLAENAEFAEELEFPVVKTENRTPNCLISFSKAMNSKNYDQWVHFYEDDSAFERI